MRPEDTRSAEDLDLNEDDLARRDEALRQLLEPDAATVQRVIAQAFAPPQPQQSRAWPWATAAALVATVAVLAMMLGLSHGGDEAPKPLAELALANRGDSVMVVVRGSGETLFVPRSVDLAPTVTTIRNIDQVIAIESPKGGPLVLYFRGPQDD